MTHLFLDVFTQLLPWHVFSVNWCFDSVSFPDPPEKIGVSWSGIQGKGLAWIGVQRRACWACAMQCGVEIYMAKSWATWGWWRNNLYSLWFSTSPAVFAGCSVHTPLLLLQKCSCSRDAKIPVLSWWRTYTIYIVLPRPTLCQVAAFQALQFLLSFAKSLRFCSLFSAKPIENLWVFFANCQLHWYKWNFDWLFYFFSTGDRLGPPAVLEVRFCEKSAGSIY